MANINCFEELESAIADLVPEDAHLRAGNRIHIGITDTTRTHSLQEFSQRGMYKNKRINRFDSAKDLVDACMCSSYIPGITGKTARLFRGKPGYIDGGLTDNWPRLDSNTVVVSPFIGEFSWHPSYSMHTDDAIIVPPLANEDPAASLSDLGAVCPGGGDSGGAALLQAPVPFQAARVALNQDQLNM
jgi:hypothetical protein